MDSCNHMGSPEAGPCVCWKLSDWEKQHATWSKAEKEAYQEGRDISTALVAGLIDALEVTCQQLEAHAEISLSPSSHCSVRLIGAKEGREAIARALKQEGE